MTSEKWIAITGTSSGIGRATALRLAGAGYSVLAGVRQMTDFDALHTESKSSTTSSAPGRLEPLLLDVTSDESIASGVQTIERFAGARGLFALISNAGIAVPGPVEFTTEPEWRNNFDVNFFGPIELIKHCLPLLRRGVQTHGRFAPRLVLVSSLGGRVAQPLAAPYTSSKFATTSLGDSLRLELHPQGIGVTIIEPGSMKTDIWDKGQNELQKKFGPDHPAREHYGHGIDGLSGAITFADKWGASPALVAKRIAGSLTRRRAPSRVLVGLDAHAVVFASTILPRSWFDAMLRRTYKLNRDH